MYKLSKRDRWVMDTLTEWVNEDPVVKTAVYSVISRRPSQTPCESAVRSNSYFLASTKRASGELERLLVSIKDGSNVNDIARRVRRFGVPSILKTHPQYQTVERVSHKEPLENKTGTHYTAVTRKGKKLLVHINGE